MHARPAGELVKEAKKYKSSITIHKENKKAEATAQIETFLKENL